MNSIVGAYSNTVEAAHTPRIVDIPAHHINAAGTAHILALKATGASVRINLNVHHGTFAYHAESGAYRAYYIAEIPAGDETPHYYNSNEKDTHNDTHRYAIG